MILTWMITIEGTKVNTAILYVDAATAEEACFIAGQVGIMFKIKTIKCELA